MIMVILSQPTPPVSELEAKQLSIMFSQILSRSCLAAMPRRTNSTTAWEDWQSQIPCSCIQHGQQSGHAFRRGGQKLTVACNNQKFIIIGKLVDNNVGVCGNDLLLGSKLCALLEFEITNGSGEGQVAVDPSKIDEAAGSGNSCLLTCKKTEKKKKKKVSPVAEHGRGANQSNCEPSFWGLWSKDKGFARPLTPKTLLESPALA